MVAAVKVDTAEAEDGRAAGMRNDFELCVAHIVPYDPVAKKRATAGNKRNAAQISDAHVTLDTDSDGEADVAATTAKPSIGKTGVHLRYHKKPEYEGLTAEQKKELGEWRASLPDGDPRKGPKSNGKGTNNKKQKKAKSMSKKQVSSLVAKQIKKILNAEVPEEKKDNTASISALVQRELAKIASASAEAATPANVPKAPTITLKSILKHAKNASNKD